SGSRVYQKDGVQNELYTPDEKMEQGIPGGDIFLTIDGAIQFFTELELTKIQHIYHPKWAAAVVLEPRTGRILAAASIPALNPVDPASAPKMEGASHWMNRVFSAEYTPGSTFKPLIMGMALDRGLVDLSEKIDCEGGRWRYRSRTVRDSHEGRYGELKPEGILIQSSNVGMSKIILRMVPEDTPKGGAAFIPIREKLDLLGLGKRPGIFQGPFEEDGLIRDLSLWTTTYSLVSLAFGREIAVTPIQMASAFAVLANDGIYIPPRLIDRIVTADGKTVTPPDAQSYRVYGQEASRNVKDMLVQVVEQGSGKKARIPGIKVAAKTGTAEKLPERKEVTSSFIAFAPADNPVLLVLVVVDEPQGKHYASDVVAPHVKAILERGLSHLNITNDEQACADSLRECRK
ncbi:MAG: penicillin-binding protein 2, partial [Planctomycetota bacterium]